MADLGFVHRYEPAARADARPLLVLHGTGGDENDLVPLARMIAPGAAVLSPRGKVLERGMPRFFRRLAEGVFDTGDVRRRANELADFVAAAREEYGIAAPLALGYSNGANIAAAVMLLRPEALAGGILLRPMVAIEETPAAGSLAGKGALLLSGVRDPIAGPDHAAALAALLETGGAAVTHQALPVGHELSQADVNLARQWLQAAATEPATAG